MTAVSSGMTERNAWRESYFLHPQPLSSPCFWCLQSGLGIGLVPGDPAAAALAGRSAPRPRQAPVRSLTALSETERPGAQHRRAFSAPSMLLCLLTPTGARCLHLPPGASPGTGRKGKDERAFPPCRGLQLQLEALNVSVPLFDYSKGLNQVLPWKTFYFLSLSFDYSIFFLNIYL